LTSPTPRSKLACVSGYFFQATGITLSASISIVIPVLDEESSIEQAVTLARDVADEVIVADGGSTDGTLGILERLDCVVCHTSRGRGQQLHAGAKLAKGEILLFLHADTWLPAKARTQILQVWESMPEDETATFCGCFEQYIDDPRYVYRLLERGNLWRAKYQRLPYGDQGVFVSRKLYDTVGGIPQISLMEDFEFARQISKLSDLKILPGPIHVDARRWEKVGPLRQTIRNWTLATRYRLGADPEQLLKKY
jgi:rSAM/selenodomain-associated transferase 2